MRLLLKNQEGRVINMKNYLADERIIKKLQADNDKLRLELENVKRANKTMDGILLERDAENDRAREYIAQVEKENDTLKYANTMFHAKEWFNNNPKCDKVYVFVLDADGVNDDGWIADSHAVASINDGNCVGSYVRNTNE